jgi:3'-phosphoadenosine 5'-phosphosulfate sulfotransferase (PAPS reductase)/FAD synthetase
MPIGRRNQPQQRAMPFWFLPRTSKIVAWVVGGRQDHSDEWAKGRITSLDTIEASMPSIGRRNQPQQRAVPFWFLSRTSKIVAWVVGGRQDHSHEWAKGRITSLGTIEESKPSIGRRYQPQ